MYSMTTLSQPHFPFSLPLANDMSLNVPQDFDADLSMRISTSPMSLISPSASGSLIYRNSSIGENHAPSSTGSPWIETQLYHNHDVAVSMSTYESWKKSHDPPFAAVLSAAGTIDMWPGYYTPPLSCSAHKPGQNSHTALSPPLETSWSTPGDFGYVSPAFEDKGGASLDQSRLQTPDTLSTCTTRLPFLHTQPIIPRHYPQYQLTSPTSLRFSHHPMSAAPFQTNSRSCPTLYRAPSWNPAGSPLRRKNPNGARVIRYDGLRIDEEELFKGMMGPNGKLTVSPCLWEEDRSPCHLWIGVDESCINAHIQKWHGGKPGGDELRVDCRWSACGKTMRVDPIRRHIVTKHLGETRECLGCRKVLVRDDVYRQHVIKSYFDACRASGVLITHSADVREIDAFVALEGAQEQLG